MSDRSLMGYSNPDQESKRRIPPSIAAHTEDVLLFDLSDGSRLITGRAPAFRLEQKKEYFYRYVSAHVWEEIRSFLMGYHQAVLLVTTQEGVAILRSELMPSASLGVAIFPHIDESVLRSLMNGRETVLWQKGEPFPFTGKRRTKRQEQGILDLCDILTRSGECLELGTTQDIPTVWEQVSKLSRWIGCPVRFLSSKEDPFPAEWDIPSFQSFLAVVLCFCRQRVLERELEMEISWAREECTALFRMSRGGLVGESETELVWLKRFAEQKNMLFERTNALTLIQLRISPIRWDVAYLGLKKPPHRLSKELNHE